MILSPYIPFCINLILVGCAAALSSIGDVLVILDICSRILPTFIGDVMDERINGENNLANVDLNACTPVGY